MAAVVTPPALPHVLLTADTVGGVWRHVADLATGLARRGGRVTVATLGPAAEADQRAELAPFPRIRLVETGLPLDWTASSPEEVLSAGRGLAGLARDVGADVVQLHAAALGAAGGFDRPVVAVHHSCVATWWDAVRGGPLPADLAWRADLVARGLAGADAVVAPTHAFACDVARRYGLGRRPRVVFNGSRPPAPRPWASRRGVLAAGRLWDAAKGMDLLDDAAAGLDAPVCAVGPLAGPDGGRFAPRHLDTPGRLGPDAMAQAYASAAVFVSLARYEPFGLAVLEAAAAGCPLVLADIPTFRELWDGAALFVDPLDTADVRATLAAVLGGDAATVRLLGDMARNRAAKFSPEATVDGYARLWDGLAGRDAPTRREAHA